MSRTYFILSREIFESAIWREDPHVLKLFLYLIGVARHDKEQKRYPGFEVKRGERVTSLAEIAEDNEYHERERLKRWSRQKVARMLDKLVDGGYIELLADTYGTHIRICNYDTYQDQSRYLADRDGTAAERKWNGCGHEVDTNKQGKQDKQGKQGESAPRKPKPSKEDSPLDKELSRALFESIKAIDPDYFGNGVQKSLGKWPDEFRKMREIDGRSVEDIRTIIERFGRDEFWSKNIRSPKALRGMNRNGIDKFRKVLSDLAGKRNGELKRNLGE